jgi:replicative DNA helicase
MDHAADSGDELTRQAEQITLGSMILSPIIREEIRLELTEHDFAEPKNATIWHAITDMADTKKEITAVTLLDYLIKKKLTNTIINAPYIHDLIRSVPTPTNGPYYAQIVKQKKKLRTLETVGQRIKLLGQAGLDGDVDDLIQAALAELNKASHQTNTTPKRIAEYLEPTLDDLETPTDTTQGIPTGITEIDKATGGLKAGQMVVIAARPGLGKSTLALDIARHTSITGNKTSAFFSLEMSGYEIVKRALSAQARVPLAKLNDGQLDDLEWHKLSKVTNDIMDAKLYLDDSPKLTLHDIKRQCAAIKRLSGLDLVIIDYLQLMSSTTSRRENRQQEISDLSRNIKLFAKEIQAPIIILSQLNRGSENRADRTPQMSDIRESGAIEQDADIIILIHREDAYEKESPRAGEADLILAKNRSGPTLTEPVAFQGHYSRFTNMAA